MEIYGTIQFRLILPHFPGFQQEPLPEPVCSRSPECKDCPYPRHGFLCWGADGTCLRTSRDMYRICGGDFSGKLHLLMDYTDHPRDVADPWYTGDFEATWQDVLAGCQGLLREITGHHHTRE